MAVLVRAGRVLDLPPPNVALAVTWCESARRISKVMAGNGESSSQMILKKVGPPHNAVLTCADQRL